MEGWKKYLCLSIIIILITLYISSVGSRIYYFDSKYENISKPFLSICTYTTTLTGVMLALITAYVKF